jgi:hypothetical protein
MTEDQWLAFWQRRAYELLGYFYIVFPGEPPILCEIDEEGIADWTRTYFGDVPRQ